MNGTKYHKIQSIFKRDRETGRFIPEEFTCPEFEMLFTTRCWDMSEKLDGTNIRVTWRAVENDPDVKNVRLIGGRTDRAQIPAHLFAKLETLFPIEVLAGVFDEPQLPEQAVTLYGEGIGPKIQKGGGRYRAEPDFVLFDVRVGRWWLRREDVAGVAAKLNVASAPSVGIGTLEEAIWWVQKGFKSMVAEDKTLEAEGLVLRPIHELFARSGDRIITKVKTKDFRDE